MQVYKLLSANGARGGVYRYFPRDFGKERITHRRRLPCTKIGLELSFVHISHIAVEVPRVMPVCSISGELTYKSL